MRLVVAALVAATLAYAAPAAAQSPTQADEDAAKAHFLAGQAYYEQANYTDAVKEFNEAHRLSRRADLWYNVSVCYERLGRWDDAIAALQQYLQERPNAPDRAVIESRITNFTGRRDTERAQQAPPATPPPIAAPPPVVAPARHRHVASLIVGGIGLGLLVAGTGTGVAAQLAYNDLNMKCPQMVCNGSMQQLRDDVNLGKPLAISTDVLLAVGGAALVTGVVLFIVELRHPPAARVQLLPAEHGLLVRF
jgi:tetratricopeptide (TPR) repeat protein